MFSQKNVEFFAGHFWGSLLQKLTSNMSGEENESLMSKLTTGNDDLLMDMIA